MGKGSNEAFTAGGVGLGGGGGGGRGGKASPLGAWLKWSCCCWQRRRAVDVICFCQAAKEERAAELARDQLRVVQGPGRHLGCNKPNSITLALQVCR